MILSMCIPSAHLMSLHMTTLCFCIVHKNLETEGSKGLGTRLHHYLCSRSCDNKYLLPLALLLVLSTHNNADSNKLMIFSGIDLYYGDTYILKESIFWCGHTCAIIVCKYAAGV